MLDGVLRSEMQGGGSLQGLRVLALESRRAREIAKLIETYGGAPQVAPSMREVPLESNYQVFDFASGLMRGDFDLVVFLTGVGIRALMKTVEVRYSGCEFLAALRNVKVAARGPKPASVLRELQVPVTAMAPEPCTWRELMRSLHQALGENLKGCRVAVQEYGAPNPEFLQALTRGGATVTRVPVYQWALPEDIEPLQRAVIALVEKRIDLVIFLTGVQAIHLLQIAEEMNCAEALLEGLQCSVVASIGPSTSEELRRHGIEPDLEPSHPKMGILVNEAAKLAPTLLEKKRKLSSNASNGGVAISVRDGQTVPTLPVQSTPTLSWRRVATERNDMDFLHDIGKRMATADSFHTVLQRIVEFVSILVRCDSCFIYVREDNQLILRASKNPHPDIVDRLELRIGQGITGWVAEHRQPVAIPSHAGADPRFKMFNDLPEDRYEAFLSVPILCRGKLVGVINVQHKQPYHYSGRELRTISTIGFLVGAEIEMARLETEKLQLSALLETRKQVERAKGILQRELGIGEEEAYRTMQRESRQRRRSMRELADAIILNEELRRGQTSRQKEA